MLGANAARCLAVKQFGQFNKRNVYLRVDRCQDDGPVGASSADATAGHHPWAWRWRHRLCAIRAPTGTALATATPKRLAAARLDIPLSIATMTRDRRSSDKVFAYAFAGLLAQQARPSESDLPPRRGTPYDSDRSDFALEAAIPLSATFRPSALLTDQEAVLEICYSFESVAAIEFAPEEDKEFPYGLGSRESVEY